MTPTPRDLWHRLQAIRGALLSLEHYCAAHPRDPSLSVLLDHARVKLEASTALLLRHARRAQGRRGARMHPRDFDFAACDVCGGVTPVPLTWVMAPPGPLEPAEPVRFVRHDACDRLYPALPAKVLLSNSTLSPTPHRDATAALLEAFGARLDLDLGDEDDA